MGGEAPAGPKMGNVTADNASMNCDIDHTIHQTLAPVVYVMVLVVGFPANCLSLYYGYLQIKAPPRVSKPGREGKKVARDRPGAGRGWWLPTCAPRCR